MKKVASILVFILLSLNLFAIEGNIKVGYDFYRDSTYITDNVERKPYHRGFVIGAEIIPLSFFYNKLKVGAGFEYNFGEKTLHYRETAHLNEEITEMIPVYATLKYTYYRKNDMNLYLLSRLGYAFAHEKDSGDKYGLFTPRNSLTSDFNTSGLYYGLGLGLDYKYFLAEILYDGKYMPFKFNVPDRSHSSGGNNIKNGMDFHHKIGLRIGVQLGDYHFKRKIETKCDPIIVEKLVEVDKVVKVTKIVDKLVEVPQKNRKIIKKKLTKKKRKINLDYKWDCKLVPKINKLKRR